MKNDRSRLFSRLVCAAAALAVTILPLLSPVSTQAQDRLPGYPGYDQYQKAAAAARAGGPVYVSGAIGGTWSDDGKTFKYFWQGKGYALDLATGKATEDASAAARAADAGGAGGFGGGRGGRGGGRGGRGGGGFGGRGGGEFLTAGGVMPGPQTNHNEPAQVDSPDGKLSGFAVDGNFHISDPSGGNDVAVTADGSVAKRKRYAYAPINYGEELGMNKGIFWSPDSKKVAYYGFDEGASNVKDYHILMGQSGNNSGDPTVYDTEKIDAYPTAGQRSAEATLSIYDVASKKSVAIDVREGKPFDDTVVGYYVYRIYWSIDGKELLFSRMNRAQNILEICAADPDSGKVRVIIREEWPSGWVEFRPYLRFLEDGKRFIFVSERNGFRNFYLYDMSGKLINPITQHNFEVADIVRIDEKAGQLYYTARDGDNYLKAQFHRVGLDGKGDVRLTDPKFNHEISLSPDGKYFTDVYQTHDIPPATQVVDAAGKVVAQLAQSDLTHFNELGLKKVELYTFKAGDGVTELRASLQFPSNFDPNKKYPVLQAVYGGALFRQNTPTENFTVPSSITEYGFLYVNVEARDTGWRGKALLDSYHGHMGINEMDDLAGGVKAILDRPYVDKAHVGVYGTSYGGTSAATLLMRFPDVYAAASSSSPVTDYRNYNDIYGERFNGLVSENKAGYDAASVMTYVPNLKGALLLYFGTSDTNVHNSNSMELIKAMQAAGKHFEVQVGPDAGHSGVNNDRMMEFFIENLVMNAPGAKASDKAPAAGGRGAGRRGAGAGRGAGRGGRGARGAGARGAAAGADGGAGAANRGGGGM